MYISNNLSRPGDVEDGGAMIEMTLSNGITYRMLLDTVSNVLWLMSNECKDSSCKGHNLYTPTKQTWGNAQIEYNTGDLIGKNYKLNLNLKTFTIPGQMIILINSVGVSEFKVGIKFHSKIECELRWCVWVSQKS